MKNELKLYNQAFRLSLFTIFYNIIEGLVSMVLGFQDETLVLFGFGVDSFIEVVSGLGIAFMVLRIKQNPDSSKNRFEVQALKITGISFYLLSAGLFISVIMNVITNHKPVTTFWGVVISIVSIFVMLWLMMSKRKVGNQLHSAPVLADANCTKVCIYMSVVLLLSSLIYEFTGFAYADSLGALGLIYFSILEGKEAFDKAKGKCCSCGTC